MTIQAVFCIYNGELEYVSDYTDRETAEEYASEHAANRGEVTAVMLAVPVGGTAMPELRALTVYDENGEETFRTHAYDSELVPAG